MRNKVFVFGSYNLDIVSEVNDFPKPGESIISNRVCMLSGGKGANQAFATKQNNAEVTFLAQVGSDVFATQANTHIEQFNLAKTHILHSDKHPTGMANILVRQSDKENMITISLGANNHVSCNEIKQLENEIASNDVLLVQLENNIDAILEALTIAKQHAVFTILNPAPYHSGITELLPYVDLITPNQTEAAELTGLEISSIEQAEQAAKIISDRYNIQHVLITLGSKGALLYTEQNTFFIPAIEATPVDTSGAGDAFNGALAANISKGITLNEAARIANVYAALAVEQLGAANMPNGDLLAEKLLS